ncbi:MAG: PorP/SprF family type IX secretion system membrane protein [Bacteroidota bacterium]|nr:PorP/SprF family type IX secretion system membrane protein [Bacteroidota bacterium]
MMRYKRYIIVIGLLIGIIFTSHGQDIHFSKFYSAPMILNPANTTNYHGNWNVITNYRKQNLGSISHYITSIGAFDMPVYIKKRRAGLGVIWVNDKSSDNTFSVNKLFLSSAYFVRLSNKMYLHMGMQVGYVHKQLDQTVLSFPEQFDMTSGSFNSNLANHENFSDYTFSYLDLNWGLIWSYKFEQFYSETGFSMFHANRPKESFFDNAEYMNPRYVGHIYLNKLLTTHFYVKPKVLYVFQGKASEFLAGSHLGVTISNTEYINDFNVGVYFRGGLNRNPNALIFTTGIGYSNFDISLSYDLDYLGGEYNLGATNSFEISIAFKRPVTDIKEKSIPCTLF